MSAATDLLDRLVGDYEMMERSKNPGEIVRLLYGGMFGGLGVVDIQPASDDAFRIVVTVQDGSSHVIIAPVSQCSFMLSIITPNAGEPAERVIFGFGEGKDLTNRSSPTVDRRESFTVTPSILHSVTSCGIGSDG